MIFNSPNQFKFAHIADVHIGSWREEKLKELSIKAFEKAIDACIEENIDFLLISGDLFNTSMPPIDKIKSAVTQLKRLKEKNIPVYVIAGSHDFSPSGKTMLDVLEEAELFINVVKGTVENNKLKLKFTTDKKTGIKITGMLGKKGMLEKSYYENLDTENLESEQGFKIFMFHTALTEFKPEEMSLMDSSPLSLLPKKFDYYAGGHVHYIFQKDEAKNGYGLVAYPGALFPCNFKEIEEFKNGGIYFISCNTGIQPGTQQLNIEWKPIKLVDVESIHIECKHKTSESIEKELKEKIKLLEEQNKIKDSIITIKAEGTIDVGSIGQINFNEIIKELYAKECFFAMKNTNKLMTKEFEEVKISAGSIEEIESRIVAEHLGQIKVEGLSAEKEKELAGEVINTLYIEKNEGEKNDEFEKRVIETADKILK